MLRAVEGLLQVAVELHGKTGNEKEQEEEERHDALDEHCGLRRDSPWTKVSLKEHELESETRCVLGVAIMRSAFAVAG